MSPTAWLTFHLPSPPAPCDGPRLPRHSAATSRAAARLQAPAGRSKYDPLPAALAALAAPPTGAPAADPLAALLQRYGAAAAASRAAQQRHRAAEGAAGLLQVAEGRAGEPRRADPLGRLLGAEIPRGVPKWDFLPALLRGARRASARPPATQQVRLAAASARRAGG